MIPAPTSLISIIFRYQKFSENTKGFLYEIFSLLWDDNFSTENRDRRPFPSILEIFWYQKISETLKGSLTNFFCTVRQQLFDGKLWYSLLPPCPQLSIKFFDTRNFLKHIRGLYEKFATMRQKIINGKSWYSLPPSFIHKIFRYRYFSETQKGSSTNFFGTVRQKKLNGKSWYPLFCIKYRNVWWNWCL